MPFTNQAGYPSPLGTEPIASGDDAIKALAASLPWIQGAAISLAGDATNIRSFAVTFPKAFPGTPQVILASFGTGASTSGITQSCGAQSASATGISVFATRSNTTTVTVYWLAVWLGGGIP